MSTQTHTSRRGGTIPELLAGAAALALLAALILPAAARMRAENRTASSLSQLRWIAGVTSSYAADNADRFWTYSWRKGSTPSAYVDLQLASDDIVASAMQGTDIMRRLSGRDEIARPGSWLAYSFHSHLPLIDYAGRKLPDENFVAPGDAPRLAWLRQPRSAAPILEYSSSYYAPVAMWDRTEDPRSRVTQAPQHYLHWLPGGMKLQGALLSDLAFPSNKVMVHDAEHRDGVRPLFALEAAARPLAILGDGAVARRAAASANPGWVPNQPSHANPTIVNYVPRAWEAPTSTGASSILLTGAFRWTRGGITGRDVGGPEVDTGQP